MISRTLALAVLALLLTSCASPLALPRPPSFQHRIDRSADWSTLANRTAQNFLAATGAASSPVYVAPGPTDMPFAAAFRDLLEQALLERGAHLQETAQGAIVLRFEVRSYWYRNERQKLPGDYASFWTTAAVLGAQTRDISSLDTALAVAGGAGPVMDILKAAFDTTNAEVTLTVTVFDGNRLTYRDNDTFFIRPTELPFYWSQMPGVVPQARPMTPQDVALPVRAGRI
jgi:hypothetical protein